MHDRRLDAVLKIVGRDRMGMMCLISLMDRMIADRTCEQPAKRRLTR